MQRSIALCLALSGLSASAQVPGVLSYQGRMLVGTPPTAFEGSAQFKFSIVSPDGAVSYWANAGDEDGDGAPDGAVPLTLSRGLYSVLLGDTNKPNMGPLPASVFTNNPVFLRVWFNDGTNGFQRLSPDQQIAAVGYAMMASSVPDGSISQAKLSQDLSGQLADLGSQLAALSNALAGVTRVSPVSGDATLAGLGYSEFHSVPSPPWVSGAASGLSARSESVSAWTGSEFLIWGGLLAGGQFSGGGAFYNPATDAWRPVSTIDAPLARAGAKGVWTGSQLVIFGGNAVGSYLGSGARFQPASQKWTKLPLLNAPAARGSHCAAWSGNYVLEWGGRNAGGILADGAAYVPSSDSWVSIPSVGAPSARFNAGSAFSGDRWLIWGGVGTAGIKGDGAVLSFGAAGEMGLWTTVSAEGAPAPRQGHSIVWTGAKFIVWGGRSGSQFFRDGASYDPVLNTWETLTTVDAPVPRAAHSVVWTGTEMLVFGGETTTGTTSTGAAYDPLNRRWRTLSNAGPPLARSEAAAVWSGSELLVFGGLSSGQPVGGLQRLNPQPAWHFYRKP